MADDRRQSPSPCGLPACQGGQRSEVRASEEVGPFSGRSRIFIPLPTHFCLRHVWVKYFTDFGFEPFSVKGRLSVKTMGRSNMRPPL